jgi:hypothetical protein
MLGMETRESEFRERLTAVLRATPPLMRVLTLAASVFLTGWYSRARCTSQCSII